MSNRLLSRAIALMSLVLVAAVFVSACAQSQPGSSPTGAGAGQETQGGPVTIEYWDWWVTQGPTIDNEIKLFEQKYPNIKIHKTTQVVDKYPELFQLAVKGGNAPDVFLIPQKPSFQDQVKLGWYLPLNKYATPEWQAKFPKGSFVEGDDVINGNIYTAPFDGPAPWLQLYINTKVFKDAGLVDANGNVLVPKTWDDVRAFAKTITQKSGGKVSGYGFGDKQKFVLPWQMMMVQNSGGVGGTSGFDARVGKYVWADNPVYVEWIKFFMAMKQDGSIIPNAMSMDDEMARAAFADGQFGMLVGGVWNQSGWEKTNPDFKDYMVVALPHNGKQQTSYFYSSPGRGDGTGFGISAQTKHPYEAWLWFSWLNSPEAAARWVQAGQGLRIFPKANNPEYAKTPQFRQYMEIAQQGVRIGPAQSLLHPEMTQVKEQQTLPDIQAILEGIYSGQITDYQAALKDLQNRQNAELARAIQDAQSRGVRVDPSWWKVTGWDPTKDYLPAQ